MLRRYSRYLIAGWLVVGMVACHKELEAVKPAIRSFPKGNTSDGTKGEPRLVGTIFMVNEASRFVLVESDAWNAPAEGTALKCMRNGKETGVVAVGRERRSSTVTADIVTGKPQKGDEVYQ